MTLDEFIADYEEHVSERDKCQTQCGTTQMAIDALVEEQGLCDKAKVAIEQARPLVSADSVRQIEALMNTALTSIFDIEGTIKWDAEHKVFLLKQGDLEVEVGDGCGGGITTALSFVLDVYALIKSGARRLLVLDEAFTAVSDKYFSNFMDFVHSTCHELDIDLLLVTHDVRLDDTYVDHSYVISDGKSYKTK